MPADKHWALWTTRHGQKCWDGPFETEGRAWGCLQMIIDAQKPAVIRGTQMSNAVPSAPVAADPAENEFATAQPDSRVSGYGPWFVAGFDSECDGENPDCDQIWEGDQARSDGAGGWLCSTCGQGE